MLQIRAAPCSRGMTGSGARSERNVINPARPPPMMHGPVGQSLNIHQCTASMRSTARRAGTAMAGSIVTSCCIVSSAWRILRSVILFICGQRLQGRMNSRSGILDRDVVAHRAFGQQHDAGRAVLGHIGRHGRGRAGKIGFRHDVRRAFRMRQNDHAGIILAQLPHFGGVEALMHLAMARPGDDLHIGLGRDVAAPDIRRAA